jgi:hypothetical protein
MGSSKKAYQGVTYFYCNNSGVFTISELSSIYYMQSCMCLWDRREEGGQVDKGDTRSCKKLKDHYL